MSGAIVVGAGVTGLATAWRAAAAGVRTTVCDPSPGRGASWAAAGMLAPVAEAHHGEDRLLRCNLASAERWPDFARELEQLTGHRVGLRTTGTVAVARDTDDAVALDHFAEFLAEHGLDAERVDARAVRRLEPALHPRVRGGLHVPGDHQVDSRRVVAALVDACRSAGVTIRQQAVARVTVEEGRATGVVLASGDRLRADHVVLAAGSRSGQLDGVPPAARPPVRPVRGQVLRLHDDGPVPLLTRTVRGLARGRSVYVVPRADGEVVVGATVEEQGFADHVTAGGVFELLEAALDLVPGLAWLRLVETSAGLRPGTPDNAPVVGPTEVEGLLLATGHFRNGVLLAPLTAAAITAAITGCPDAEEFAPLTIGRFR